MRHAGELFRNDVIELDGNEFLDCRFLGCKLFYRGGPLPYLDSVSIDESCVIAFRDGAGNTLEMLRDLYRRSPEMVMKMLESESGLDFGSKSN